jgi:hypothetical protein
LLSHVEIACRNWLVLWPSLPCVHRALDPPPVKLGPCPPPSPFGRAESTNQTLTLPASPPRGFSKQRMEASASGPSTSAAADAGATHYLAKRVLRGSAVLHVIEGRFRSPDTVDVVLGKVRPPALLPLVTRPPNCLELNCET